MPINASAPVRKAYDRDYYRRKRSPSAVKSQASVVDQEYIAPSDVDEQVSLLVEWSRSLKCPPGHPRAGESMDLPDYLVTYLDGALRARESLLSVARKNAKSTGLALLALGYLCGPLRVRGWRGAVVSLNLDKSREFLRLAVDLAHTNNLPLKAFAKRLENRNLGSDLECLPATSDAGHASGYDAVFLDELGLYPEKSRSMIRGMYSAITARDGRIFCISIRGDNEVLEEIIQRGDNTETYVQVHAAGEESSILDEDSWHQANPGLKDGIKSIEAMRFAAKSAASTPSDIAFFKSHELNLQLRPDSQVLVTVDDWIKCESKDPPGIDGPCYLGVDLGAVSSMSAATAYFPKTNRMLVWGCFPEQPDLSTRGNSDGVGSLYHDLVKEGSLRCFGDRIPDYRLFLEWVLGELGSVHIEAISYDRFRKPEMESLLDEMGIYANRYARGTGASSKADGSHDVRSFQRAVLTGRIQVEPLKIFRAALRYAVLRHDPAGNPALDKSSRRGRIDVLSAAVLAVGTSSLAPAIERRAPRFAVI